MTQENLESIDAVETQDHDSTSTVDNEDNAIINESVDNSDDVESGDKQETVAETSDEEDSTSVAKQKKPRHRQVDAAVKEAEERILREVDNRLAVKSDDAEKDAATIEQERQQTSDTALLNSRISSFQQEVADISNSSNEYDRKVSSTMNEMKNGNSVFAFLDANVNAQIIKDGVTPAEVHELNSRFGDKITPSTPDVEYRNIKFLLSKVRSNKPTETKAKTASKPSGSIKGGQTVSAKRDAEFFANRFRGY